MISPKRTRSPKHIKQPARNRVGSPTKENQPMSSRNLSTEALHWLVQQMKNTILKLGGTLPNQLQSAGLFKLSKCTHGAQHINKEEREQQMEQLKEQVKSLSIKLANTEFELKKVIQDEAEGLLKIKMERDREAKRYKTEINRLQAKLRDDNQRWGAKCEELRKRYEQTLAKQVAEVSQQYERKMGGMKICHEQQLHKLQSSLRQQFETLLQTHITLSTTLTATHKSQLDNLLINHQSTIQTLTNLHQQQIKQQQKKYQQMINKYNKQLRDQQAKREQDNIKNIKIRDKLYNDLYLVRREKEELARKAVEVKGELGRMEQEGNVKQYEWNKKQQQYKEQLDKLSLAHIHNMQKQTHTYILQTKSLTENYQRQLDALEKALQALQTTHAELQQKWREQVARLEEEYCNRPSRVEDRTRINELEYRVAIKNEETRELKSELQRQKLQKQNNEKNYKRIFSARGGREKGDRAYNTKDKQASKQTSKQRAYKIANTIDMSFLLKVCNKNF